MSASNVYSLSQVLNTSATSVKWSNGQALNKRQSYGSWYHLLHHCLQLKSQGQCIVPERLSTSFSLHSIKLMMKRLCVIYSRHYIGLTRRRLYSSNSARLTQPLTRVTSTFQNSMQCPIIQPVWCGRQFRHWTQWGRIQISCQGLLREDQ
jgi:hypothetical protein